MKNLVILLVSCLLLISCSTKQTTPALDKENFSALEQQLDSIYQTIAHSSSLHWDSITFANEIFNLFLKEVVSKEESIFYPFDSLSQSIQITTSDDQKLRIFSWDTRMGGTMKDFANLFQFKNGNNSYTISIPEAENEANYLPFYSKIYRLETNKETYYLCVYNGIYSSKDVSQSICALTIQGNQIVSVPLFKINDQLTDKMEVYFDFFSVVDRPERPLELILFDSISNVLQLPVINGEEQIIGNEFYHFNGKYFELKKR